MKNYLQRFLMMALFQGLVMPTQALAQNGGQPPARDAKFEAAIQQCATDNGIELPDPSKHQRPNKDSMEIIRTCMEAAGFTMPSRPPHERGERAPSSSSSISGGSQ